MRRTRLIILLLIIIFNFSGCTGGNEKSSNKDITTNKQLTEKERLDDFEYMYTVLKENHPYLEVNKRVNGIDWLSKKDEYISKIKLAKDDQNFFDTMEGIIEEINNKHTSMINKDIYYYAKSAFETSPEVSKAWLTQLNNPKAISRYSTMKDRESTLKLLPKGISPDNVKTIILKEDKAAYLSINIFNTFNINGDMEIIKPFLTTIKDYQSLIIDIRGNTGGDSRYWCQHLVPMLINKPLVDTQYTTYRGGSFTERFLKSRYGAGYEKLEPILKINELKLKNAPPELKDSFKYFSKNIINLYPENSIGFKGKIYLIVDGGVFSSSEAFATFSKSTGFATIVGERTGGDGIGDDPAMCVLPNSGYIFRFPMVMGLTSDGTCNFEYKTEADIKVSAETSSDLANDKAVQTVLNIVTNNDHSLD